MAKSGSSNSGCATVAGGFFSVFILLALVPRPVWIILGVGAAVAALIWFGDRTRTALKQARAEAAERERERLQAQAVASRQQRELQERRARQALIADLGEKNAAAVESAQAAARQVAASEAARAGWLGDVDFTADLAGVTDTFRQVHALRGTAAQLAALNDRSQADRRILGEARTTVTALERSALERVALIEKCASEARLVDDSLRAERDDARTAEQRAELHAKLSSLLYGIEAAPSVAPVESAADSVIARVQAYREIKNQIQLSR